MKKLFLLMIFNCYFSFCQESKLNSNFVYKNIFEWDNSMKFVFAPNSDNNTLYRFDNKIKGKPLNDMFFKNKILTYSSIETYPKNTENCKYICIVFELENNKYAYKIELNSFNKFKSLENLHHVPNLIFYNDYLKAVDLFLGKKYYLREKKYKIESMNDFNEIYINEVILNDDSFPVKIKFSLNNSNYEYKLSLSGINKRYNYSCYNDCIAKFNYNTIITSEEYLLYKEKEKQDKLLMERKNDSLLTLKKIRNETKYLEDWKSIKDSCFYRQNNTDEITGKKIKKTYFYDIQEPSIYTYENIAISVEKIDNEFYIIFRSKKDLGCVTPYNNKSNVKIKFTDNSIFTFNHIGDLDCKDFYLISKTSLKQLNLFKNKKIKFIRLEGTKYYEDINYILFDDFFKHILKCLTN